MLGHSLGGSLGSALVCSGLLPREHVGPVTVIGVGAPPAIFDAADGGAASGPLLREPTAVTARFLLVVNGSDVVPRLLGSPLPFVMASALEEKVASGARAESMRATIESLQRYAHPEQTELLLLREGRALAVPREQRPAVLHVHEAIGLSLAKDHKADLYVAALEQVLADRAAAR